MSPGYEARTTKALAILKLFYGPDVISPSATAAYKKIHELLVANGNDEVVALAKFREWSGE